MNGRLGRWVLGLTRGNRKQFKRPAAARQRPIDWLESRWLPSSLSINNASVLEGDSGTVAAEFTVFLSEASAQTVTVEFSTSDSTAHSPSDYLETSGTLTFAPGQTSKTIDVTVNGDTLDEGDETFLVRLNNAVGATINDSQGEGTIRDDDTGIAPTLSINNVSVTEGNTSTIDAVFTVFLSEASGETVTVDFSTTNDTASAPSDYLSKTGTLTFAPGDTSETISITVNGDTLDESDETFVINLRNAVNASIFDNQGVGTIRDDDPGAAVSLSINNVTVTEGDSGTTAAEFTVSLSTASGQSVAVDFFTVDNTASAPSDYQAINGSLNFDPGEISKTITVLVNGDTIDESDEVFLVRLRNAVGATINDNQGDGTIRNDDSAGEPALSINNATVFEGNTGTTTDALFTVSLSHATNQTVTVIFATADSSASAPSDYQSTAGTLTFDAGETSKTISVPVNGDAIDELDETFFVNLTNATNATLADSQGVGTIRDDDPALSPSLSINDVTVTEGNSGTVNAIFTVSLSATSGQAISVDFTTADGTANAPADYATTSGTLTFAPGETTKTVNVSVNGDTFSESNETFFVNLTNATNTTISDGQGVGTIRDDDSGTGVPSLSINDLTVVEGNSGASTALFTVFLSSASSQAVTVDFTTADGAAIAGSDYQAVTGTLTFAAGDTSKTISVPIIGDTLDEFDEAFFVNLTDSTNAPISDSQGIALILDDDPGLGPNLSINDVTVTEGNSGTINANFTVQLSSASTQTVTVFVATADGTATSPSDYASRSGTLTFTPGETSKILSVPVKGDTLAESNETFLVNLSSSTNASIADSQAVGTIRDDDSPTSSSLTINDVTVTEGNSGTINAVFTVSLTSPSTQTITVDFATADGSASAPSDYQARSGTLTFAPGITSQTISVPVNGDIIDESDETFFVELMSATNASIADLEGIATIADDDAPTAFGLSINDVSVTEGNLGTTMATFTVSLARASTQTVTVNYSTTDGTASSPSDYQARAGTLTFTPGDTIEMISVVINGDTIDEANEQFFVNLSGATNATVTDSRGTGTIIDDDSSSAPVFSINDVSVIEGDSRTTTALFNVTLSSPSSQTVTVHVATSDGTAQAPEDYTSNSQTLTFLAGETIHTFAISVKGDTTVEPNETFVVNLSGASGADIIDSQGIGTIIDDDSTASPLLSINNVAVLERNGGTTTALFTVALSTAATVPVTVDFTTADGSAVAPDDYTARSGTVTFTPGQTSATVAITVNGDTTREPDEQFLVRLSNAVGAAIAVGQGTGTILNDDSSTVSGRCSAGLRAGVLVIAGDNTANMLDIVDDGSGNVSVVSDCGVASNFAGVKGIQVRTRGGVDDVHYRLTGNLTTARTVSIDLGAGNDQFDFSATGIQLSKSLALRVLGKGGLDQISAAVDALLADPDTDFSTVLSGDNGQDRIDASIRLQGTAGLIGTQVLGGGSNDSLRLILDSTLLSRRALIATLDGSGGTDSCTATGPVVTRRC